MGAVDLVLQVESPKSVTAGLQRIGRAGHNVGDISKGRIFPKFRADLLECAVVAQRMREGLIETTVVPRNPLDVLAQQIVAMAASAEDDVRVGRPAARDARPHLHVRASSRARSSRTCWTCSTAATRARSSASCGRGSCGTAWRGRSARARAPARWPSPTRARSPTAACSPSTSRTAAASASSTRRWSTRRAPGQVFLLGASSWRIEEITRDRVIVTPAPGVPGAVPFWKGDGLGRPRELGEAIGAFARWAVEQDAGDAGDGLRPRPAGGGEPARVPARAAGGDARRAERPHDRDRALPRRDRRLARVRAVAVRRPRARRLGAGAVAPGSARSTASSRTRSGPTTASSSTSPTPTSRRARSSC